jgi:hypothetical protein
MRPPPGLKDGSALHEALPPKMLDLYRSGGNVLAKTVLHGVGSRLRPVVYPELR